VVVRADREARERLQHARSGVVGEEIVEEAAEVLESNLLGGLLVNSQGKRPQVVLIGDHKQLQPAVPSLRLRLVEKLKIDGAPQEVLSESLHRSIRTQKLTTAAGLLQAAGTKELRSNRRSSECSRGTLTG